VPVAITRRIRSCPFGDGFDGIVDGNALVVKRFLAATVFKVIQEENFLLLRGQVFPCPVFRPEECGRREGVAVGGEDKGNIDGYGVRQPLLHAVADGVGVVLGLDQGDGGIFDL
jgi:hypothetical protein